MRTHFGSGLLGLLTILLLASCGQETEDWSPELEAEYMAGLYGDDGAGLTLGKTVGKADAAIAVPRGVLALTFDDGPQPGRTAATMDILEAHGITGVFFQLGHKIESYPELMAEVDERGHHVANHSYVHKNMPDHENTTLADWVQDTRGLIGDHHNGHYYFRPPYGGINDRVRTLIEGSGYKVVLWNIDTLDWDFADGKTKFGWVPSLFREDYIGWVMYHSRAIGGGVALFHDVHQFTVDHLDTIITYWKDPAAYWDSLDEATRTAYLAYYDQTNVDPYLAFTFANLNSYHWPLLSYEDGDQPDPVEWLEENQGWIGGLCESDEDCNYQDGFCFRPLDDPETEEPSPFGVCSKSCTKYCPDDLSNPFHYQTFCVEVLAAQGQCMPKCTSSIPCQDNYQCQLENRLNDATSAALVCMPIPN